MSDLLVSRAGHGFPRERRLLDSGAFRRVFQSGKRSSDRYFVVLARPNSLDRPRLGLAIAKRQLKRAAWRNRVKRLVRESFRAAQHDLAGMDIVVRARPGLELVPNPSLAASLQRHWGRLAALPRA